MRSIQVTHHEVEQGKTVRQRMAEDENIREKMEDDKWRTKSLMTV